MTKLPTHLHTYEDSINKEEFIAPAKLLPEILPIVVGTGCYWSGSKLDSKTIPLIMISKLSNLPKWRYSEARLRQRGAKCAKKDGADQPPSDYLTDVYLQLCG